MLENPIPDEKRAAVIISATSDIGTAMSLRWLDRGWSVLGTYRTASTAVDELESHGASLVWCDLSDPASIREACARIQAAGPQWDVLAICAGSLEPVGAFTKCDFDEWEASVMVNFTSHMRVLHELLPGRRSGSALGPCVLLFAGAGANDAPVNYSAYVASKIALTKMCELLDAEISDTRFAIVGPGWVKTKIHNSTLRAGAMAGPNYARTVDRLAGDEWTRVDTVLDCCDWIVGSPRDVVSGRNFSVVYDKWGTEELETRLTQDQSMYMLRRFGNEWSA